MSPPTLPDIPMCAPSTLGEPREINSEENWARNPKAAANKVAGTGPRNGAAEGGIAQEMVQPAPFDATEPLF